MQITSQNFKLALGLLAQLLFAFMAKKSAKPLKRKPHSDRVVDGNIDPRLHDDGYRRP